MGALGFFSALLFAVCFFGARAGVVDFGVVTFFEGGFSSTVFVRLVVFFLVLEAEALSFSTPLARLTAVSLLSLLRGRPRFGFSAA